MLCGTGGGWRREKKTGAERYSAEECTPKSKRIYDVNFRTADILSSIMHGAVGTTINKNDVVSLTKS